MQLGEALRTSPVFTDGDWVESKDQDPHGDVRLVQLADIGVGRFLDRSARFLTHAKAIELRCTFLAPGDVLIARMPDPIGRACIFPGDSRLSVTVVDVCVIRCDSDAIDPHYLVHVLNGADARHQVEALATGSTRSRVSRGNLSKVGIRVPSLHEQRRLAAILDHADALRTKRHQVLASLDALAQAMYEDMIGSKDWPYVKIKTITSKVGSGATPRGGQSAYKTEGVALIRSMNVHDGKFRWKDLAFLDDQQAAALSNVVVEADDVLLNITGASVARVNRAPASVLPARVNQHVAIIRPIPGTVHPRILERHLISPRTKRALLNVAGGGATREAITKAQILDLAVPMPDRPAQEKYLAAAARLDEQQGRSRAALEAAESLFVSLQFRAFRGEL